MKQSLLHCSQYINSLKINLDNYHNLVFFIPKVFEGLKIVWTGAVFVLYNVLSLWLAISYGLLTLNNEGLQTPRGKIRCNVISDAFVVYDCIWWHLVISGLLMAWAGGGLASQNAFFKYCCFVNHSESFLDSKNMLLCFVNFWK